MPKIYIINYQQHTIQTSVQKMDTVFIFVHEKEPTSTQKSIFTPKTIQQKEW